MINEDKQKKLATFLAFFEYYQLCGVILDKWGNFVQNFWGFGGNFGQWYKSSCLLKLIMWDTPNMIRWSMRTNKEKISKNFGGAILDIHHHFYVDPFTNFKYYHCENIRIYCPSDVFIITKKPLFVMSEIAPPIFLSGVILDFFVGNFGRTSIWYEKFTSGM